MFIRKKLNKSGSCSVLLVTGERVAGKKHPVSRIIKNFGSAFNESDIVSLVEEATLYKARLEACAPKAKTLKITCDADFQSCRTYNVGFSDVYGNAFNTVFSAFSLKPLAINKLKSLITMRIAAPASKRRTAHLSADYGMEWKVDTIYKLMDEMTEARINQVKKIIYNHTTHILSEHKETIDVLFYDLTTIYFETSSQDEIRNFGFSKDGKHQHVQIMLAVIVTKNGLPIDYEEFPGNCYEGHTLLPVLNKIRETYNIDNTVLVADAALMNKINLQELDAKNIKYIIAARLKNLKKGVKQAVINHEGYVPIKTALSHTGELIDVIKTKSIDSGDGDTLVLYHSDKRARKDAHDRQKDIEKIKNHINSTAKSKLTGRLRKSYVSISKECKINIDDEKLAHEALFDGFFGMRTNIKDACPEEILSSYRGLWQVEQTFRIAKHNLEIRPVFHYTSRRIKAHFALCYMALALVRYVDFTLQKNNIYIPCEQLHLMLEKMRKVEIADMNNELFEILEDPPVELIPVYQALNIKWHRKFIHKPKL